MYNVLSKARNNRPTAHKSRPPGADWHLHSKPCWPAKAHRPFSSLPTPTSSVCLHWERSSSSPELKGISETTGSRTAELLFTETWRHLDQRRLSSWHLIPPQPSIYLDSLFQGWPWEDKFSSYYLFTRIKEIYEDTNFHYLVKIKFCKITGFGGGLGQLPPPL